jgi:hypothetical protein
MFSREEELLVFGSWGAGPILPLSNTRPACSFGTSAIGGVWAGILAEL